MQWYKVKRMLLVILAIVNLFFGVNLLLQYLHSYLQRETLRQDVMTVLRQEGIQGTDTLQIPLHCSAISLSVERDMEMEEQFAQKLLSDPTSTEETDGTIRFSAQNGSVVWKNDGSVDAKVSAFRTQAVPSGDYALRKEARAVLRSCGISMRAAKWTADDQTHTATMTSTIAGLAVFGRSLSVCFGEDGALRVYGQWSFGTPYARSVDREHRYEPGDAILRFARGSSGVKEIRGMEFGYRMEAGTAGTLQLSPVWRFTTDKGVFLVNVLKTKWELT